MRISQDACRVEAIYKQLHPDCLWAKGVLRCETALAVHDHHLNVKSRPNAIYSTLPSLGCQSAIPMTWYQDLRPCDYFDAFTSTNASKVLRAVGWLSVEREFTKGQMPKAAYDWLKVASKDPWQPGVFCGVEPCTLCTHEPEAHGSKNLFVPGNGFLYVCPELITHYANAHQYCPPDEFVRAVLDCPPMKSRKYLTKVLENGGRVLMGKAQ